MCYLMDSSIGEGRGFFLFLSNVDDSLLGIEGTLTTLYLSEGISSSGSQDSWPSSFS